MHLTDQQINEYLDNESADRALIEAHLGSCDECAVRFFALQALFTDLDSLPEATLSKDLAARFLPDRNLTVSQLPRWLTLTATLQAILALITLIVAIPFVSTRLPQIDTPSFTTWFSELQLLWTSWLDLLSTFQLPAMQPLPIPALEISSLLIALASVSILWVFGNGLLLRNHR